MPDQPPATPAARDAWVARVLNVELLTQRQGTVAETDLAGIWWNTKETVNQQLEALRRAFLATGNPLAPAACEKGLGAFTGGTLTRFQAAIIDCRGTAPPADSKAAANLRTHGAKLSAYIQNSKMLPILERNPFGINLTLRRDIPAAVTKILHLISAPQPHA